jgi:hypothetical protein
VKHASKRAKPVVPALPLHLVKVRHSSSTRESTPKESEESSAPEVEAPVQRDIVSDGMEMSSPDAEHKEIISESQEQVISESQEQVVSESQEQMISESQEQVISESQEQVISESQEQVISESQEQVISESQEQVVSESQEQVISESQEHAVSDSHVQKRNDFSEVSSTQLTFQYSPPDVNHEPLPPSTLVPSPADQVSLTHQNLSEDHSPLKSKPIRDQTPVTSPIRSAKKRVSTGSNSSSAKKSKSPRNSRGSPGNSQRDFVGTFVKKYFPKYGDFYGIVVDFINPYYQVTFYSFLIF